MNNFVENENLLLEEAYNYANVKDEKELFKILLLEYINNHRQKKLSDLKGKIKFSDNYEYKKLRLNEDI